LVGARSLARGVAVLVTILAANAVAAGQAAVESNAPDVHAALVAKYCVPCHNDKSRTGGLLPPVPRRGRESSGKCAPA